MTLARLAHAHAEHEVGIVGKGGLVVELHHGRCVVFIDIGQADHLRHGAERAGAGLDVVGGRRGLQHHHRLAFQLRAHVLQPRLQVVKALEHGHARLAVRAEGVDQRFGLHLDGIVRHGVAGVHIVDGNARRAHDVAVGLLRGVAHNHQIRLEGDDGFNIEVGIVRHLQLLGAGGKVLGPVDNAAGGDGDHGHAHFIKRQHRRGGKACHALRRCFQHDGLGIAARLHIFRILDGHARGFGAGSRIVRRLAGCVFTHFSGNAL